jgi:hypothetical protein
MVKCILDPFLDYVSATPAPSGISGDTLTWTVGAMNMFESNVFDVTVTTPATFPFPDTVRCTAVVIADNTDIYLDNNLSQLSDPILSSYDPNDKICLQGDRISTESIEQNEELIYQIRFQNTGNYQADRVVIADTLNPHFDLSTFRVISSSHDMTYEMGGNGIVNFIFDPIVLPAAIDDELGSHGFVKYGIKPKASTQLGNCFTNTAYIYFDFNPPIVTNTTSTLVVLPEQITLFLPTVSIDKPKIQCDVYPNPANDFIKLNLSSSIKGSVLIYDLNGKLCKTTLLNGLENNISVADLSEGLYLLVIKDKHTGVYTSTKIVVYH